MLSICPVKTQCVEWVLLGDQYYGSSKSPSESDKLNVYLAGINENSPAICIARKVGDGLLVASHSFLGRMIKFFTIEKSFTDSGFRQFSGWVL